MSFNLDTYFGVHEQAMKIRASRAEVLANNLANSDTPGFKARDIDFRASLSAAMDHQQQIRLMRTDPRHLDGGLNELDGQLGYRMLEQPDTGDANTVDTQIEQSKFAQNALEYQMSVSFLTSRIQGMLTAIKGE